MNDGPGGEHAHESGEPVGNVGEEAAKLFGALSDWAREHGPDLGDGVGEGIRGIADHVDTGAAECTWCPVCRTMHLVRSASPEVRDHLTTAAASLMQAAAGVLAAAAGPEPRRGHGVEHIDLDDETGEWPEEDR